MIKVAIIGGGPRGLWAAEELLELARQRSVDVDLHVYDDGFGVAYSLDQPEEWLVNVRSSIIRTQLGSFDGWLRARGVGTDFPPRRMVGEFLADSWAALKRYLPRGCSFTEHAMHVEDLEPDPESNGRWTVHGEHFDEVLLATGHAAHGPGALTHHDVPENVRLISSPYPASNLDDIGPHDRVLVRGAALTFIDITRVCQPAVFIPITRTGQLMSSKPDTSGIDLSDILDAGAQKISCVKDLSELQAVLHDVSYQVQQRA